MFGTVPHLQYFATALCYSVSVQSQPSLSDPTTASHCYGIVAPWHCFLMLEDARPSREICSLCRLIGREFLALLVCFGDEITNLPSL